MSELNAASVGGSSSVLRPVQMRRIGRDGMAVVALAALALVVPDEVDLHQPDAGLDQPPRHQDRLAEDVAAVTVASGGGSSARHRRLAWAAGERTMSNARE